MRSRFVSAFKIVRGTEPLKGTMGEIAEQFGLGVALTLMREFGGREIFFPSFRNTLTEDHPIVKAIGRSVAHRLPDTIIGNVRIPLGPFAAGIKKFYIFAKRRRDGATITRAIANLYMHERTAYKWNALLETDAIGNRDFIAYGKAIGDEW